MEITSRKAINCSLKKFCSFAEEHDFIEVTEWSNVEGFDISIDKMNGTSKQISLTHGELEAIKTLIGVLEYNLINKNPIFKN